MSGPACHRGIELLRSLRTAVAKDEVKGVDGDRGSKSTPVTLG